MDVVIHVDDAMPTVLAVIQFGMLVLDHGLPETVGDSKPAFKNPAFVAFTVTVAGDDVVASPMLSVAFAVIEYVPGGTADQLNVNGGLVTVWINVDPLKNSTLLIVPSGSEAVAASAIVAGAEKTAPLPGAVKETAGGWFAGPVTVTVTGAEVVTAPSLSVATAVSV
jgi:hypothetical protein